MQKSRLLQTGVYPEGDETALNEAFIVYRYDKAADKEAFPAQAVQLLAGSAKTCLFCCDFQFHMPEFSHGIYGNCS